MNKKSYDFRNKKATGFTPTPIPTYIGGGANVERKTFDMRKTENGGMGVSSLNKRGFTIIELLVVIAIIAVLSSIIMVVLSGTKEKSRDARRVSDMHEIQSALNLYFTDNNRFPIITSPITITGSDAFSVEMKNAGVISRVPVDPVNTGTSVYSYVSSTSGVDYTISFCMETNNIQKYSQGCGNTINP